MFTHVLGLRQPTNPYDTDLLKSQVETLKSNANSVSSMRAELLSSADTCYDQETKDAEAEYTRIVREQHLYIDLFWIPTEPILLYLNDSRMSLFQLSWLLDLLNLRRLRRPKRLVSSESNSLRN